LPMASSSEAAQSLAKLISFLSLTLTRVESRLKDSDSVVLYDVPGQCLLGR